MLTAEQHSDYSWSWDHHEKPRYWLGCGKKKKGVCQVLVVCRNYHTILSPGTKCNLVKRKIEKLLNSNIHLSHWLEDAFTGCFLKPKYTMKVISDVSLLFLKGIILHQCHYQWLLLTMLLTLTMYLTNLYTAFPLAILPPYPLLLPFLAPLCPSTSLLQHHWASVWSLHSLTKSWVLFTQPEMSSTSTINRSQSRTYTASIQCASGWKKKEREFIEEHRKKHPVGASQRRRFWGDLLGAFQYNKEGLQEGWRRTCEYFSHCCRKTSTKPCLRGLNALKGFLFHTHMEA